VLCGFLLLVTFNILPLILCGQLMKLRYLTSPDCQVRSLTCSRRPVSIWHGVALCIRGVCAHAVVWWWVVLRV
jgi:hypothetical protein